MQIVPFDPSWPAREGRILEILAKEVRKASGRLWVVGGAVRDTLRGVPAHELDLEVYGLSAESLDTILQVLGQASLVGRQFAVWKLRGAAIDVALPRRERAIGPGHKDFEVVPDPSMDPLEAARRRDFTINALLWDPLTGELADPTGGIPDLQAGVLRHASPQFSEDPLRVLRAMQFAARFRYSVAPETIALCRQLTPEALPPERLWEEWRKLIEQGAEPSRGLTFLRDCGWIQYFPELEALIDCPQDPEWHPEGDVWNHTLHCLDAFAARRLGEARENLIVGLAVLCHDFGKPATTEWSDGRWRSPRHENEGVEPARTFLERLTRERSLIDAVLTLVATHMRPHQLYSAGASDTAVRRLAAKVERIDRLVRVSEADARGRPPIIVESDPASDWLLGRAEALAVAAGKPEPLLQGRDLIARGHAPGPTMGTLLKRLFEAQLEGAFTTYTEGLAYLDQIEAGEP